MGQLTETQLKRLEGHKYSCQNTSLLEPYLQPFWCWLVQKCPLNLAPNLITITGLAINISTALVLIYHSPRATEEVPRWSCFLCALGLFIYQSLDAIDGKQARRTGTSSPLGELFDHGCDSVSTLIVCLSVCCAVKLGTHPYWMFFQTVLVVTLFYCAHWQTYVSGTLRFGFIDVTEAQFAVIGILMVSAIFGPNFWSNTIPVIGLAFMCLPVLAALVAGSVALHNNFTVILIERGIGRNGSTVAVPGTRFDFLDVYIFVALSQFACQMKTYIPLILWGGMGRNGSSIAGTSVLSPVVPLSLVIVPAVMVAWKSTSGIYLDNPALYLLTFGCVAARVTNRLVVAHMTKSEMAYTDRSMLGPGALFLNQYFNTPIPEYVLLWVVCAYVWYDMFKYCWKVCVEICSHLNICLFTIPSPTSKVTSFGAEENGSGKTYTTRSKTKSGKI